MAKCLNCQSEFERNSNAQKHCSGKCRIRFGRKLLLKREPDFWKNYYANHRAERCLQSKEYRVRSGIDQKRTKRGATAYRGILNRCGNSKDPGYCRYGAKGVKCLLTFEEFQSIYFGTDHCDLCDRRLTDGDRRFGKSARTIDRIDPKSDYKIGNLRVVCRSCNARGGALSANKIRWQNQQ